MPLEAICARLGYLSLWILRECSRVHNMLHQRRIHIQAFTATFLSFKQILSIHKYCILLFPITECKESEGCLVLSGMEGGGVSTSTENKGDEHVHCCVGLYQGH